MEDMVYRSKKEDEIKDLIFKLRSKINEKEIIAVVYNPNKEEGMNLSDCSFLKMLFDKNRYTSPIFILSGHGGDFKPGIYFPHIIIDAIKTYTIYVPSVCGSALCYTILKSKELWLNKNSKILQIDPKFEYEGEMRRAIKVMKDNQITDIELKDKAKKIFLVAEEQIKNLCVPPSVFKYESFNYGDFGLLDSLAAKFMNKEDHETPVTIKELKELEANIKEIKDEETNDLSLNLIAKCQDYTIDQNVRVIFISSIPLNLGNAGTGHFICPLK